MKSDTLRLVDALLAQSRIGVISTLAKATSLSVAPGSPEVAVVAITGIGDGALVFATTRTTHKAQNILADGRAAVVAGWEYLTTVQMCGVAYPLAGSERDFAMDAHIAAHPDSRVLSLSADEMYFRFEPAWIRYSDFTKPTPLIVEMEPSGTRSRSGLRAA